jgi:N-acetylglutamate synthase-like GNAT family acetyltransferase
VKVVPFRPEFGDSVLELILKIQREEFGIQISADQQPDLREIPSFYQVDHGNFWVALSADDQLVGTIALLDIGSSRAALRKMFVDRAHRGGESGVANRLLETLVGWSSARSIREIYLGTTSKFHAAHRFYEKNDFEEIAKAALPPAFPIMEVDTKFYRRTLHSDQPDPRDHEASSAFRIDRFRMPRDGR